MGVPRGLCALGTALERFHGSAKGGLVALSCRYRHLTLATLVLLDEDIPIYV